jgi:hypothetical protein
MRWLSFVFFVVMCSVSLRAQFENITLPLPKKATYYYSQVEPSIYINPKNTNEIIAGSVMDDYYWSDDAGRTWNASTIKSKWGVNGDPCMLIDTLGRYYYFHLSNIDGEHLVGGIVSERSNVLKGKFKYEGHTLVNGKYHDKEWAVVNPYNNEIYMTWTQFDGYESANPEDESNILFSRTTDGGLTWSVPKKISAVPGDCMDNDQTAEGAVPSVGLNGEIYVVWSRDDTLWFNCSTDGGDTWMPQETPVTLQPGGWVVDIPGIYRCNGMPVTAVDRSDSPDRGTLYVNWADQRNGTDDTDIWLIKSTDKGKTWGDPVRVNNDVAGRHQFLTWMTIDQVTGYLYFVFYDRRNYEGTSTDVYLAWSKDGGETIENVKISESSFRPNAKIFFGDYTNISVHNGVIRPIWTRLDAGQITLHTALIEQKELE